MLEWFQSFFKLLWQRQLREEPDETINSTIQCKLPTQKIHFESILVVNKTPKNDAVGNRDFIEVIYQGKPLWALFQCPCGCGKVISLSLQKVHTPNWKVKKSKSGRPTLYPSVWQNQGCCSHFWIKDGMVYWCYNTGVKPWAAEPKYHYGKSHVDNIYT